MPLIENVAKRENEEDYKINGVQLLFEFRFDKNLKKKYKKPLFHYINLRNIP